MEQTTKPSETQAIIDLASQINPVEIGSKDHISRIALPPGWTLKESNDENLLAQPARKQDVEYMHDADSFVAYINRHKVPEQTTIRCDADYKTSTVKLKATIDDHEGKPDGQHWGEHRVHYNPRFSTEWDRWIKFDGEDFTQLQFALFLEDNMADIANADGMPTGQQLLEMALSFEANQDMRYKSAIRTQSGGINMSFVQDDDNQTLVTMKVFEKIAIGIPVFWGGDAYQITARLRYRVKEGTLKFWYELIRADKVLEDATKTMIEKIKTETGAPLFFGSI